MLEGHIIVSDTSSLYYLGVGGREGFSIVGAMCMQTPLSKPPIYKLVTTKMENKETHTHT